MLTFAPRIVVRSSGTPNATAVLDVGRTVAGPASYAAGGFEVDLSASYSSLLSVLVAYGNDGRVWEVDSTNFATGKFKLMAKNPFAGFTPAGSVAAPVFTGNALGTHQHGVTPNTRGSVCVATCNCTTGTASPTTVNSTLVSGGTPSGTNTAPAFTGTAQAALAGAEVANGANLSASTVAYWVVGVPA